MSLSPGGEDVSQGDGVVEFAVAGAEQQGDITASALRSEKSEDIILPP
jgi:hypothetical protein